MLENKIRELVKAAILSSVQEGLLSGLDGKMEIEISVPKSEAHGDFTTNIALVVASRAKIPPRKAAEIIAAKIPLGTEGVEKVEIAGPGFINFKIDTKVYLEMLRDISVQGERYGSVDLGSGKKVQIEFVSANPTGPLHIGHGRGAVYGDALASVLSAAGYEVTKEYYVNDTGNQIKTLGRSVYLRYLQKKGSSVEFPKECYQGSYIAEIATEIEEKASCKIDSMTEEDAIMYCGEYAGVKILDRIKHDLAETGVIHDTYFHENNLHADSAIDSAFRFLKKNGHTYEEGGALWFNTMKFGDDKNRVLRKADGSLTYFAADIAYHKNKFDRGFHRVIDIWGADHGGYVARMKAAVEAMGYDPKNLDVVLIQLVNLMRGGESISMSTRSATYETLENVRDEVGRDACRYFFLMRSHNAQLDFDLDLAKKETPDNPVFYIQYAHARICSIFRKAEEAGFTLPSNEGVDLSKLDLPEEIKLSRMASSLPNIISECAEELEPHKLSFYLLELSRMFQSYYSQGKRDERYRVISTDAERTLAKLYLLKNIQVVIQNSLRILGISAPSEMKRMEEADV